MDHRRDIEGLRALAVLAVLSYHFGIPGFGGGYVGVDVFFVVSGFLITSLLVAEFESTNSISLRAFWARRARRLLPISATVLAFTCVAAAVLVDATRLDDLARDVAAAALFSVNYVFAAAGTDYLAAAEPPSLVQHYWSLAVEEQFYLLWPVLILLVARFGRGDRRRRISSVLVVIAVASFGLSAASTSTSPSWSYFGLHTRAWELAIGALLAVFGARWLPESRRTAVGWAGLVAVAISVVTFGDATGFPGWIAIVPVLGTAAILAAGDGASTTVLLHRPVLQWIGSRSYSLYLWHWPVLMIAKERLGDELSGRALVAVALVVVGLSEIGFRSIENPVRRARSLRRDPVAALCLGAVMVAVSSTSAFALSSYDPDLTTGVLATTPTLEPITGTTITIDPAESTGEGATETTSPVVDSTGSTLITVATPTTIVAPVRLVRMDEVTAPSAVVEARSNTVVPDNLLPPLGSAKYDTGIVYDNDCHVYFDSVAKTDCVFGDPNGSVTVALFGDSHAAQWFPALDVIAAENGWRLLSLTQGGCPFLDVLTYNGKDKVNLTWCQPWRDSVREYLRSQNVSVVFLSQYYRLRAASDQDAIGVDEWDALLPALVDSFRADGIEPVLIADSPYLEDEVPGCLAANRSRVDRCAPGNATPELAVIDDSLRRVAADREVGLIEPRRWLCVDGYCPPVVGNLLVYRDQSHLSATFVQWLTPLLAVEIVDAVRAVASGE